MHGLSIDFLYDVAGLNARPGGWTAGIDRIHNHTGRTAPHSELLRQFGGERRHSYTQFAAARLSAAAFRRLRRLRSQRTELHLDVLLVAVAQNREAHLRPRLVRRNLVAQPVRVVDVLPVE